MFGIGKKEEGDSVPPAPTAEELQTLKDKYKKAGQEQVFKFYDELEKDDQARLYAQLQGFDVEYINKIAEKALHPSKANDGDNEKHKETSLEPLPESATASILDTDPNQLKKWYDSGLELIGQNKVGVVLMAGGQGTRLGSSAPKGCFDIGLPSKKSLFQIQAERIRRLQTLASKTSEKEAVIPWYVMTSGPTRKPTEQFFEEHDYFGLEKENVIVFEQGVLPCISNDGKILLESKSRVAVAPDGNGGIYNALVVSPVLGDIRKRGIEHVHAYCVDNCLVKVADPTFTGFAASKKVDIATKVVRKRSANESVGLIVAKNGKPDVVEYSEIDKATAEEKDPKNHDILRFRAANIVNHYYSFGFLESIPSWAHKLPHHVARKKIPSVDLESGQVVKPDKPNGVKLEQFVFDVFPMLEMDKFACLEVKREDEFSPLKNASGTGEDDPESSKKDLLQQGARWAMAAGAGVTGNPDSGIDVSPLYSYGGEGMEKLKGTDIQTPAVIEKP